VVPDFVTFARGARNDVRVFGHVFADDKESGFDVVGGEKIEQFWCKLRLWTVVKGHGDVGTVDMDRTERDLLFRCGVCFFSFRSCRRRNLRSRGLRSKEEKATGKKETAGEHGARRQIDACI